MQASDFNAALHEHLQYLQRMRRAAEQSAAYDAAAQRRCVAGQCQPVELNVRMENCNQAMFMPWLRASAARRSHSSSVQKGFQGDSDCAMLDAFVLILRMESFRRGLPPGQQWHEHASCSMG